MRSRKWTGVVLLALLCVGGLAGPANAQGRGSALRREIQRERQVQRERREDRRDARDRYRRLPGSQEPAFARGYSDGYEDGLSDLRKRNRYDPVGEKDYRDADQGYFKSYGPKGTYQNNYRAGFRQGYDDGYRERGVRR